MSTPVTMPQLGESVTEGTVTRWLKQVGETVDMDEPLLEVSTDKVDTEIPSPVAGVLHSIEAPDDAIVEVGGLLGTIGTEAADSASAAPAAPAAPAPPEPPRPAPPAMQPPTPAPEPTTPATDETNAVSASTGSGTEVTLPELGESVTEGTVTRWLKQVGDTVAMDEPLLEISTDKVDTEIPAPVGGTLLSIAAGEDDVVEIGALLAVIGDGSASAPSSTPPAPEPAAPTPAPTAPAPEPPAPAPESAPPAPAPAATPPESAPVTTSPVSASTSAPQTPPAMAATPTPAASAPASGDQSKVAAAASYVTPLVRKLAAQGDIDLSTVTGTGVGGRIRRQDVERAIAEKQSTSVAPAAQPNAPTSAPSPDAAGVTPQASAATSTLRGTTAPMTRLRKVIADRMVESLQTSAQLTTVVEADVTAIAKLRDRVKEQFQQREGVKLSFLPFFALAVIEALKVHPNLNASIDSENGQITYHGKEDLGVAVDTERGLLVPVIRDAGELNLAGLARRIADIADRTRTNRVTPDELSGGTFTLTNTGSRGALFDTPIINQPQVAILGTGTVNKRPVVIPGPDGGDVIAVHSMMYLALTYDHRLVDGADAARFLVTVKNRLEEGAFEDEVGL